MFVQLTTQHLDRYAHAIFKDGLYPAVMRQKINEKSSAQGFPESRLPEFSLEESAMIAGSSDFLGINFYTANLVFPEQCDINDVRTLFLHVW